MKPVRRCLGCYSSDSKDNLLRVVAVSGRVVVDGAQNMPGRGGYVHRKPECVKRSVRSRVWARALRESGLDLGDLEALTQVGTDEKAERLMDLS